MSYLILLLLIPTYLWSITLENARRKKEDCWFVHPKKVLSHQHTHYSLRSCRRSNRCCWCKYKINTIFMLILLISDRLTPTGRLPLRKRPLLSRERWDKEESPTHVSIDFSTRWALFPSRNEPMKMTNLILKQKCNWHSKLEHKQEC